MPTPLLERPDEEAHLFAELRVEVREGLVEEENARLDDHRAGERDALLLAARELAGVALPEVAELHRLEDPGDALGHLALRDAPHLEPEREVLPHRHVGEEGVVLEHHADVPLLRWQPHDVVVVEEDVARARLLESRDAPQGGGLAAARRAEEGDELVVPDLELEPVHRGHVAEALGESSNRELGHVVTPTSAAAATAGAEQTVISPPARRGDPNDGPAPSGNRRAVRAKEKISASPCSSARLRGPGSGWRSPSHRARSGSSSRRGWERGP